MPLDDGVKFRIKRISEIMDEAEYPGIRVSMETEFDHVIIPLKLDISTGDVITPREVKYRFKLMLEDRTIELWAYNLETVLAEKLETVISRATTNTRMRDFYDLHILSQLYGQNIVVSDLEAALLATAKSVGQKSIWQMHRPFVMRSKPVQRWKSSGRRTGRNFPMRLTFPGKL